jgi:hypothetical protein
LSLCNEKASHSGGPEARLQTKALPVHPWPSLWCWCSAQAAVRFCAEDLPVRRSATIS